MFAVILLAGPLFLAASHQVLEEKKSGPVVILDFASLKPTCKEHELKMQITFGGNIHYIKEHEGIILDPETMAELLVNNLRVCGGICERVEKTKVRITGFKKSGKFHPVQQGSVRSKTLPKNQLPKVTNLPRA